jgi:hypothetical protein
MSKLNLDNLSTDDLKKLYAETEDNINKYYNQEQSVKRILNSIYGAFGNEYFYFFNINIAESITLQGQNAILYTEKLINLYFTDFWHKDKELHSKLGIEVKSQVTKPVVIYIDTDSCYLSFEEALLKSTWQGTEKDFILKIYEYRLNDYIKKILQKYADGYKTENFLDFELESIAKNAIWLAKKKYIQNIVWADPGNHYDPLTKIKTKGFEIIQSSTPLFARKRLNDAIKLILGKDDIELSEIVKFLKEAKREFKLANIEDICFNLKMNNYEKYIVSDVGTFEFALGCPMTVRAAGYHNFLLNSSKYKNKYQLIGNAEKMKMYETTDKNCNVFAFKAGSHPYEIAPPIDYEAQFEKCMIDPLNRVLSAIGMKTLDRNLIYSTSLF